MLTDLIKIDPFKLTMRIRAATSQRNLTVFEELQKTAVGIDGVALNRKKKKR